jgi:hypothetical protein
VRMHCPEGNWLTLFAFDNVLYENETTFKGA